MQEESDSSLRDIPKVELHCHLEACFRPATVMEVGRTLGLDVPQDPEVFHREWLLSRPLANLEVALARFVDIQRIWCAEEVIERMTFEACEDAVGQSIRLIEFRYSPDFIAFGKPHLDAEKIHRAILRGIARAEGIGLATGLIGIIQKTLPLEAAARTADFIAEAAESFVGLDFADRDTHPLSAYETMVNRARAAGLHITVHAGEEPGPQAPGQVRDAIEILGVPVTINSDDPGLFGIDLCHEYAVLQREHGFTREDFARCNGVAAQQSFLPDADTILAGHPA